MWGASCTGRLVRGVVSLNVASLLVEVDGETKGAERALNNLSGKLDDFSGKATSAGLGMSAAFTAPLAGAAAAVYGFGASFESAFAGVIKTVDATAPELAAIRQGILDMSKELPASANEIAGVAEAAGQLGIAKENILDFSRTMIDLGEATNLTSEQAAQDLARFANITQMPQENFDRLGSTIVSLGNNLATTEADIVSMSMRLAGVGAQVGLTEADILGIAGAMSSLGIAAESGGTAVSRVLSDMAASVATGNEQLAGFAEVAGLSVDEFSTLFENDAARALQTFVEGLGGVSDAGGDVFTVLEDLGLADIRVRDALLRMAGGGDILADSLDLAAQAWEENTALTKEAETRYGTVESQVSMLFNKLKALAITLYDALRPALVSVLGAVNRFVDSLSGVVGWVSQLDPSVLAAAAGFAALLASIGPVLLGLGAVVKIMALLTGALSWPIVAVAALAAAFATDFMGIRTATVSLMSAVGSSLSGLGGHLDSLGKYFSFVVEEGDYLNDWLTHLPESWQGAAQGAGEFLASLMDLGTNVRSVFESTLKPAFDRLRESWEKMKEGFGSLEFSGLATAFEGLLGPIQEIAGSIARVFGGLLLVVSDLMTNGIAEAMAGMPGIVQTSINTLTGIIEGVTGVLAGVVQTVKAVLAGDWAGAWRGAQTSAMGAIHAVEAAYQGMSGIFTQVGGIITRAITNTFADFGIDITPKVTALRESFQSMLQWFQNTLEPGLTRLKAAFLASFSGMGELGPTFSALLESLQPLVGALQRLGEVAGTVLVGAVTALASLLTNTLAEAFNALPGLVGTVIEQITAAINTITTVVTDVATAVKQIIEGDYVGAFETLKGTAQEVAAFVTGTFGRLGSVLKTLGGAIKGALTNTLGDLGVDVDAILTAAEEKVTAFQTWMEGISTSEIFSGVAETFSNAVAAITSWSWPLFPETAKAAIDTLVGFIAWPTFPQAATDAIDAITGWVEWPEFPSLAAIAADQLDGFDWPTFPEAAAIAADLLDRFDWPTFPAAASLAAVRFDRFDWPEFPSAVSDLINRLLGWSWPNLPGGLANLFGGGGGGGDSVPGNAAGTSNWRGGWTLVGEEGPELVNLPKHSAIYPADESQDMMAQGQASGGSVIVYATVANQQDIEVLTQRIAERLRRRR